MAKDYVFELTERWVERVEDILRRAFPMEQQPYLNPAITYHLGTGGKRIRPVLCLAACEQLGGDPEEALPLAAATEILHNMFLVHDDVEDGDTVRRDQPTLWAKYGMANAVNCGDYMLGRACRLLLDAYRTRPFCVRLLDLFTGTLERTIEGQALDMNMRGAEDFSVEEYMEIIRLKTGYYLGFAIVGAAVIAGAPAESERRLAELGLLLGPAFQIRDDVLDLTEGKGRGGMIGSDIREGKPSILYAAALPHCDFEEQAELVAIMRKPREDTTSEDADRVLNIYKKYDITGFALRFANQLIEPAMEIIETAGFKNPEVMKAFARYMIGRKK